MIRTRHWAIIGMMVVAQAAVVAGYYGMLTSEPFPAAAAQTVVGRLPAGSMHRAVSPEGQVGPSAQTAPQKLPDPVASNVPNPPGELALVPTVAVDGPILVTPPIKVPVAPEWSLVVPGKPRWMQPMIPSQASGLTLVSNQEGVFPQPPMPAPPSVAGQSGNTPGGHDPLPATNPLGQQANMPLFNDMFPPPPVPVRSTPLHPIVNGGIVPGNPKATPTVCPWSLTIKIAEGRTLLTAQDGPEIKFTILCDRLTVQTAGGLIQAGGKVVLTAKGLEGSCDGLFITWSEDAVILINAHLKCKVDGRDADFQAQEMRLQLTCSNATMPTVEEAPK